MLGQIGGQDHSFQIGIDRQQVWFRGRDNALVFVDFVRSVEIGPLDHACVCKHKVQPAAGLEGVLEGCTEITVLGDVCVVESGARQILGRLGSTGLIDVEDVNIPILTCRQGLCDCQAHATGCKEQGLAVGNAMDHLGKRTYLRR